MQELKDRIVREGKVLPGNIIKVDGFLNHRVDTELMDHIAEELGRHFDMDGVDVILTAEASGIALAAVVARHFGKPMIFAKKAKSDNIEGGLYQSDIFSYTYKKKVTLLVSKEWLHAGDRVLVVDDFMANGEAMRGLCDIVEKAGATLVGIGCAVEKGFQGGGDKLREAGDHLLCTLNILRDLFGAQLLHHKRLEQFDCHLFGQTALVDLQFRSDHDNRTAGIVHTFSQKVLTETAGLTF